MQQKAGHIFTDWPSQLYIFLARFRCPRCVLFIRSSTMRDVWDPFLSSYHDYFLWLFLPPSSASFVILHYWSLFYLCPSLILVFSIIYIFFSYHILEASSSFLSSSFLFLIFPFIFALYIGPRLHLSQASCPNLSLSLQRIWTNLAWAWVVDCRLFRFDPWARWSCSLHDVLESLWADLRSRIYPRPPWPAAGPPRLSSGGGGGLWGKSVSGCDTLSAEKSLTISVVHLQCSILVITVCALLK